MRVKLFNVPDKTWVLDNRNCIKLFACQDIECSKTAIRNIEFKEFHYDFGNEVVGVPYIDKECTRNLSLYHPEGSFVWRGARKAKIALQSIIDQTITQGSLICKINLMSIQYFNLMRRHDNSDKGLRSSLIKIELINEHT